MCRNAREKAGNSIYHISVRGNNKQEIFRDDEDRKVYLDKLRHYQERYQVKIYAYCLMTNHVHLLIYDNNQDISRFMQGLNLSYVIYFNRKHGRTGHLFQDRFNSVRIKNEIQFMYVSKYIHLNPVKANMVERAIDYKWSSFGVYLKEADNNSLIECEFLLKYFSSKKIEATRLYDNYVNTNIDEEMQDEIAITEEVEESVSDQVKGMEEVSKGEVFERLENKWNQKVEAILTKNKLKHTKHRMMVIYLVGLLARKTYKEVSRMLNINLGEVYQSVKRVVNKMIVDADFKAEVVMFIN